MPKITPLQFSTAYEFGKLVQAGELSQSQAVEKLVADYGMDAGSADGYVRQLTYFLNGSTYTRTINDAATLYYLEKIAEDFGQSALISSLRALRGHIEYYEKTASNRPSLRAILKEFDGHYHLVSGEPGGGSTDGSSMFAQSEGKLARSPTIFFNTAWMKRYMGIVDDDYPIDGGSWETKHEVCNFLPVNGRCYGYVQPPGETIAIERIGAEPGANYIDGVTVVWSARHPTGHTVLVGVYRNARIFRNRQLLPKSSMHAENSLTHYFAECAEDDALLQSDKRRSHRIPRGPDAMGQSLI